MDSLIIAEYIKYIENRYSQNKKFKSKILDCIKDKNLENYSNEDLKKKLDEPMDINYINEKVYNEEEFKKLENEFDNKNVNTFLQIYLFEKDISQINEFDNKNVNTFLQIYLFEKDIYLIVKEILKKKKELNIDNFMEEIEEFKKKYSQTQYAEKHADILEKIFNILKK